MAALYCYTCDDVRYKRKDRPDAWCEVERANGAMYRSYPFFSFIPGTKGDEEPVRHGDFIIDIDTHEIACSDAIKIVEWFNQIYDVDQTQWRIYLSGKKGVHLELPASILGTVDGHVWLPLGYKRLAKDIEGELNVVLDTSMYNKGTGKPFRQPNIMRGTGTCKRQIVYDSLFEITTDEEYIAACSAPGPIWEPDETGLNPALVEKMHLYLVEATKLQASATQQLELSDDDLDRISISTPQCISQLANLRDPSYHGATFNDVAMQLCAYAVTAKKTEAETVAGCKVFIENYPSTSLNTAQKRYDNFRARFRTMLANGNQHSCAGIKSLRVSGFDCSKCGLKPIFSAPVVAGVEQMTKEDLIRSQVSMSTNLDGIDDVGGLLGSGMAAMMSDGMPSIRQYAFPAVVTMIARVLSGKITCQNVWPNIYCIKIGGTSTGKTESDSELLVGLKKVGLQGLRNITHIASGPALLRGMQEENIQMFCMDECGALFRRYNKSDPTADGIRDAMMELFSSSGKTMKKMYGKKSDSIIVESPCLTFIGNTTQAIFDSITENDFMSGLIPRFDFFCYDGKIPYRGVKPQDSQPLKVFAEGLKALWLSGRESFMLEVSTGIAAPVNIGLSTDCKIILDQYSRTTIDEANIVGKDSMYGGIISRKYHGAIKYALVHIGGTRSPDRIYDQMEVVDIQWGIKVVETLCEWKKNLLSGKVVAGEFHQKCEIFKEAIAAAIKATNQRPTFGILASRKRELKNWEPQDSEKIIRVLAKRGEIIVDESGRKTAYFLPKNTSN